MCLIQTIRTQLILIHHNFCIKTFQNSSNIFSYGRYVLIPNKFYFAIIPSTTNTCIEFALSHSKFSVDCVICLEAKPKLQKGIDRGNCHCRYTARSIERGVECDRHHKTTEALRLTVGITPIPFRLLVDIHFCPGDNT